MLKIVGEKISSPLNLPDCLDFYVYEYELKNVMTTLSKDDFVLPKKRKKNGGLISDIFRLKPAEAFLQQSFKDVLTISTAYLPTKSETINF